MTIPAAPPAGSPTTPLTTPQAAQVAAMVTHAHSLRAAEQRTAGMALEHDSLRGRRIHVVDDSFGKVLPRPELGSLVGGLHRTVKPPAVF